MKRLNKLHFGPAGIPHAAKKRSTKEGIITVKTLGLDAMELEFVRKINLTESSARDVGEIARQLKIILTVHAPYYINLAATDSEKREASVQRIIKSATIGSYAGAWSVCFHAGYYLGRDKKEVYNIIKDGIKKVVKNLEENNVNIWIRPEVTGKPTQFGDIDELLSLSQEFDMVMPVIDFAHLHARSQGKFNTYDEFVEILSLVEDKLGREGLNNMHLHISGIDYGEKGEKQHLNLSEADLNYIELLKALRDFKVKGVVICESPNLEEDALVLKNNYLKLLKKKNKRK